jgi:alpha-D-glucose phosphate-specific phosphoglucomutase
VIREKADGAINFTASHNPPEYNGIKFSTPDGAPALPEATKRIETEITASDADNGKPKPPGKAVAAQALEPRSAYLARLREIIDFKAIQKANLRVVFDPFWGAARGYSDSLLREAGVNVSTVHDCRDVLFGGHAPEPDDHLLAGCREQMRATKAHIGIATDGDADRFGIIDDRNRFVSPNVIISLLALYLKRDRKIPGGLARSVATTHLIDAIARKLDVELFETPVGFKYIGELILEDKIAMGGEESAGMSMYRHLPEKDGILACLLVAEMVAATGKKLNQLVEEMYAEFGYFYSKRIDMKLTPQLKESLAEKLANPPKSIDAFTVRSVNKTDGVKLIFDDNNWLLFRLSGTEPVARIYAEACSPRDLKNVLDAGKKWALS